jgi:hypothetical protein
VELDLLRQRVKVRMEDAPETIAAFANADIAVLRSGKAKKNEPPIPADLAPISGAGKRVRKIVSEEEAVLLEPIRFRYSTETIVEEPEEAEIPEEVQEPKHSRSRRRRRNQTENKPEGEKQPEAVVKEKKELKLPKENKEGKPQTEGEEAAKKVRRRPSHRRRRHKTGGETPKE